MSSDPQAATLAVIVGRAGSKGLPGKNARLLAGRPMIAYSIDHASRSRHVDRVVVSTDGEDIARAARAEGADVVMRPASMAGDDATVDEAVRHAVNAVDARHQRVVILYANVPVRPPDLVDRAIDHLVETGADSVQSYAPVGKHHPWWMVNLTDGDRVSPWHPNTVYRRQDLPDAHFPDGGVIALRREALFTVRPDHPHAFLGKDRRGIRTRPGEVVDIDDELDLVVADSIIRGGPSPGITP